MGREKQINIRRIIYVSIIILIVLLHIAAWNSTVFCDVYITYVFPVWVNLYGRLTGLFPFSVGEWLLIAGALLVLLAVVLLPFDIAGLIRRRQSPFLFRFYRFFLWGVLIVWLIMTLNCAILYHATPFSEKYFAADSSEGDSGSGSKSGTDALEELVQVYNLVAGQCNMLSGQVERDEKGVAIYTGGVSSEGKAVDMKDKAREIMRQLGESYGQLNGWYPRPKAMFFSDFMCQQHMQGYFFPFTMEANYNDVMYQVLKPATMCHELAHLRGYILEDEANFISYLACTQCDDIYFQYSGYLSVLAYLTRDLHKVQQNMPDVYAEVTERIPLVPIEDVVWRDDTFVSEENWERINKTALLDTEVVDAAADVYLDVTLKANGVSDGKVSYSRVVELLLLYYRTKESVSPSSP